MRVCLGGTFNTLHKGHKLLISTALNCAGKEGIVFIGIAIGDLIKKKKNIKSFEDRKDHIVSFLSTQSKIPTVIIEPIANIFGPTLTNDYDAIVVSHETVQNARLINTERKKRNLTTMKIIEIPLVKAKDGKPISSTRIQSGEISGDGEVFSDY